MNSSQQLRDPSEFLKTIPGSGKSMKSKMMELGTVTVQNFAPVKSIDLHLSGFAFYCPDLNRQVQLHHYGNFLNDEVGQFAVYDSDTSDARLIGVEYVISEKLFDTLPKEEQQYWHSHASDVHSGSFIAPRVPSMAENKLMDNVMKTYGKTWVFWQVDRGDPLPMGPPQLMMVATKTEEWNPKLFENRDKVMGTNTNSIRKEREKLETPKVHQGADCWKQGKYPKLNIETVSSQ